jgi:hypothetical protein
LTKFVYFKRDLAYNKVMKQKPRVEIKKLTDALPDPENANEHTQRGQAALEKSISKRGVFRPIAAAGKGVDKPVIKAGNLTQEVMLSLGMDEAIFVYSDGKTPIVHVREDLDPDSDEAALLAIEDNRIGEMSLNWKPEVIEAMGDRVDLSGLFTGDEIEEIQQSELEEVGDNSRTMEHRQNKITPVLYIDQVEVFEQAILAAHIDNRGDAIQYICQFFLDNHDTKG